MEFRPWWQSPGDPDPSAARDVALRIGAWSIDAVERSPGEGLPVPLPLAPGRAGVRPSIGDFLGSWLEERLGRRHSRPDPVTASWLVLEAEALWSDYGRGPLRAWKRLVREWKKAVPQARPVEVDLDSADDALATHAAALLRDSAEACWSLARDGRTRITLLGPFLDGGRRSALIELTCQFVDVDLDVDDLPWVERLTN